MPARFRRLAPHLLIFLALAAFATASRAPGEPQPVHKAITVTAAAQKPSPESVEDLKAIEAHVQRLADKLAPVVVGLQAGDEGKGPVEQGSGVIVSADGKVLTAGHVSGKPNRALTVILSD